MQISLAQTSCAWVETRGEVASEARGLFDLRQWQFVGWPTRETG
jgi:hypothetical protein